MLKRIVPHLGAAANHPLFKYETRLVKWGGSVEALQQTSFRVLAVACVTVPLLWILTSLATYGTGNADYALDNSGLIVSLVAILGFLLNFALDYYCLSAALPAFSGEVLAGRWDLLRLTPITVREIIAVKHAIVQVRAWRMMMIVIAVRVASVLITVFHVVLWLAGELLLPEERLLLLASALPALGLVLLYVIEPWWRMRAVTALGLALSARMYSPTSLWLTAIGATLLVWILQMVFTFGVFCGLSGFLAFPMSLIAADTSSGGAMALFWMLAFMFVFVGAAVYGYYAVLKDWSQRRTENRLRQGFDPAST